MYFKIIVPWLFVLNICLAYALPAAQQSEELDPNHVHDEHCGHPIKEAFNKVKQTISGAYNKTKATVSNAFENLKKKFSKTEETSTSTPPLISEGVENPDTVPTSERNSDNGFSDSSGRSNSNSNNQTSSTMSVAEIEAAIDPRLGIPRQG